MSYGEKLGLDCHGIYVRLKSRLFNQMLFCSQIFGVNVVLFDTNETLFLIS
jgi:hypothetical protein